ncbi:MAG: AAA family ATPase [Euryarchaeota archaeon]|nr:AAA family ATPase [Euryarchaeota archaeon]
MWYKKFGWTENVFSTRPNPNLVGLEKERGELGDSAESGRILWIIGKIGSGKTSLLLLLEDILKKTNKTPVILEGVDINTKEKFLSCFKRHRKLSEKILLRKYPKNLVALLDEGEKFPSEVTETLRTMWDKKEVFSIVIATTDTPLQNFSEAFRDRIGKTINLPTPTRGDLVEIIRKRVVDKNPFTSEAMIIIAENSSSPRRLLENCAEICRYCAEKDIKTIQKDTVNKYITKTRQEIPEKQKTPTKRAKLSPTQQRIADVIEKEVNTVGEIAKELNMNDAAVRTQVERMIKKGRVEIVSDERPKRYRLKN